MTFDYLTEKKLRPLYEAIDDGQYKQALQHANKMLKKTPEWPLIKAGDYDSLTKSRAALKAIVLIRTGKSEEAAELCQEVQKAIPADEATLQAATMALKELGDHTTIVKMYESAANAQPKNEEFANHWFMAMVRNNDHKGQQQAALKLHRAFKHDKYLFWAIMSLALQGQAGAGIAYTLAERMMSKAQTEGRLSEVEHMQLYLLILLDQKKEEEALALFSTALGEKSLRDPDVRQIRTELLIVNKKWHEVLDISQQALIQENSDDWIHWLAYFDAIQSLVEEGNADLIQEAFQLIEKLKKAALEAPVMKRGPFLAELELDYRLGSSHGRDPSISLDNIIAYFHRFGSKSCCFEDLQTYISYLRTSPEKAKQFIQTLEDSLQEPEEKAEKIKSVFKRTNIRKLERFLDLQCDLTFEQGISLVNALWKTYQDTLPLGEGLEKTEYQYGDEHAILASHVLLDLYYQHKDISLLIQAVALLEIALAKSISNFHIKLTLARLYTMLGVCARPQQIIKTMDIKQIQYDTMIHYFTDRYITLGCHDEVENMLFEALSIYKSNDVETPEMLVRAYQFGTFSKIQEFIEFRRRLDTSLQHAIINVEIARIDSFNATFQTKYAIQFFQDLDVSKIKFDDAFIESRSDNRDFKVFMNCNSKEKPTAQEIFKPAASTNKIWLQMFSYILNVLSAACDTKESKDLQNMVEHFGLFLKKDDIQSKVTTHEYWLAQCIYELANALVLSRIPVKSAENTTKIVESLKAANSIMETRVTQSHSYTMENISWMNFHETSIVLEAYSYSSILIEMMNRALGLNSKDAKRKAAENTVDELLKSFTLLQATVKKTIIDLQASGKSGKDLFKAQLQKKMFKLVIDRPNTIDYFNTKESHGALNDTLKIMIASWGYSIDHLVDEINRRVQKI
ncbi:N-acetyltransferase B complex non catalytic subunit-domain-containing protein [Spinellus fusiger]|nr:N-acetyltransferase B complex non catalytic subunit-domain-containing protein [Spinellus fusiger]